MFIVQKNVLDEGGVRIPLIKVVEDGIKMAVLNTTYNDKERRDEFPDLFALYAFSAYTNKRRAELTPSQAATEAEAQTSTLLRAFSQSQGKALESILKNLEKKGR